MAGSANRVSQACNPCRSKKRRCDGARPVCGLCTRLHIECHWKAFDSRTHHAPRQSISSPSKQHDHHEPVRQAGSSNSAPSPRNNADRVSALRANSGALSADLVRQDLGSANGRSTHTAPWNLGITNREGCCEAQPIFEILSQAEYDKLVPAYFEKIHVLQGSFSEALFLRKKKERWEEQYRKADARSSSQQSSECLDLLFSAVGCLGALFSGGSPHMHKLAETGTMHLHQHLTSESLTAYDVDALLLRTLYMRLTAGPRAGWMSSCIVMTSLQDSLIRTHAGPHGSGTRGTIFEIDHADVPETTDMLHEKRYRLARHLHDWISNEAGRPSIFHSMSLNPYSQISDLAVGPGWELLTLAELSQRLDPDQAQLDAEALESLLQDVYNFPASSGHKFVFMSQAHLLGIIYRRLRSLGARLSTENISPLVSLCCRGLDAAQALAADHQPWHHCANVPFQVLCTFLLLDARESLSKVSHALATIRYVYECFPTPTMQKTLQTSTHLVDLARQRKDQDSADLSSASSLSYAAEATSLAALPNNNKGLEASLDGTVMSGLELSPGLLEADFASWDNIDWDQVMRTDATLGSFT